MEATDPRTGLTETQRRRIYDFYCANENNGVREMAAHFSVTEGVINGVVNKFLTNPPGSEKETIWVEYPSKMNFE